MFLFIAAIMYMLIKNRCKFNKRTKVVMIILSITMVLQASSAALSYQNSVDKNHGVCAIYPLAYTLLSQQHIVIMIIYSFCVCRMLSIYYKMEMALKPVPSCKARQARRISNCQNVIIIAYSLTYTILLWTFHFIARYSPPKNQLNNGQKIAYIILGIPKIFYELMILLIFFGLYKKFNALSRDYQTEQKETSGGCFVCTAKIICLFVGFMYFLNTLLFDIVGPWVWYTDVTRDPNRQALQPYATFLNNLQVIMCMADFLSCMSMLYLIHTFGPYRQYLRQAELLSTRGTIVSSRVS